MNQTLLFGLFQNLYIPWLRTETIMNRRTLRTSLFLCLVFLATLVLLEAGKAATGEREFGAITLYMESTEEEKQSLELQSPDSDEEQLVDCPEEGNVQGVESLVGTWESPALRKDTNLSGEGVTFILWAQGDVQDVMFTIYFSYGEDAAGSLTTERKNLVKDTPLKFTAWGHLSDGFILKGDNLSVTITFDGEELPVNDKSAEVVFASKGHPAGLTMNMSTMELLGGGYQQTTRDHEEHPGSLIWNMTLYRSFGEQDVSNLQGNISGTMEGLSISFEYEHLENQTKLSMVWTFVQDNALSGDYLLNATVEDYNGNIWWASETVDLLVAEQSDLDFILEELSAPDGLLIQGDSRDFLATLDVWAESILKGLRPVAYFQVRNSANETIHEEYRTLDVDSGRKNHPSFSWTLGEFGNYTARLWVDYLETEPEGSYLEWNDLGTAEENNFQELSFTVKKKPDTGGGGNEPWSLEPIHLWGVAGTILLTLGLLGLGALVASEPLRFSFFEFLAPYYTRLSEDRVERDIRQQNIRGRIYQFIKDCPGVNFTAIRNEQDIGTGTTAYHLSVLQRERFIRSFVSGREKLFWVKGDFPREEDSILLTIKKRILALLSQEGEMSRGELKKELGVSGSTLHSHIKDLVAEGMVVEEKRGRQNYCYLSEAGQW